MEGLLTKSRDKKYPAEQKMQVVTEYLAGVCSLHEICRRYRISGQSVVRKWIKKYTCHEELKTNGIGREVYMTSGRKTTFEERVEIVEFCISNGKDYRVTIEKYNISYQQIYGWVRKYEEGGAEGLSDHRGKPKDKTSMTEIERLQAELRLKEAQNRRLQMENDLLKKLDEIERRRG
jgi:transposase-like protein